MKQKGKMVMFIFYCIVVFSVLTPLIGQVKESTAVVQSEEQISPFDKAVKDIQSTDPYIRRQAAEQLGMLRDIRAVPYLKKLLKDENPFVRQAAVDSLGLLRAQDALDDILNIIATDKEVQVRQSAIVSLGYIAISDKKVIDSLINVLEKEEPVQLKYAACNTLSILRSTEPIPVLRKLTSSEDVNLQRAAVYALGKISHPDSISALRETLEKNLANESLSVDIIRFLVDLGDKDSVEKFKLIYSTTIVSERTKFFAAYGIAKLSQDTSVLPIIKKNLKSSDEMIKNSAVEAAGIIGDKECLNILLEMQKVERSPYTKLLIDTAITRLKNKYPSVTPQPVQKKK